MKEIKMGEQTVRVRATPLALLYYKQEFRSDLLGDLVKMKDLEEDPSKLDTIALLQLIWAMNKADEFGKQFPSFETWLNQFENLDISDTKFIGAAMEEAANGFFRGKLGKKRK